LDLDVRTSSVPAAPEARITKVAHDACKLIDTKYPIAGPSDEECAVVATRQAMIKVRKAAAVAGKGTTR